MVEEGLQPDYAGHEAVYRRLREQQARPGWDAFESLARDLAQLDDMLAWDGFPRGGELLEIGCGAGNVALHLAWEGWRVSGIDIAPTAISWARDNARSEGLQARFEVGDVLTLAGIEDASVDVVLDGHCLHCIIGTDRLRVLASVRRVLRPAGVFCVRSMCNEFPVASSRHADFDPSTRYLMQGGMPSRYIGRADDILRELQAAGFRLLQSQVLPARDENDVDELLALVARD